MKNKSSDKKWYAIYVRSRSEKKVITELELAEIDAYLPLITRIKQWSDRRKKVEEPLFRSYVFVHVCEQELFKTNSVFGVVKFISFEGKPVVIPDQQILAIKKYLEEVDDTYTGDFSEFTEGQTVRIKQGQMEGLIGRLVSIRNKNRLLIHIEAVGKTIAINISRSAVEPA